MSSKADILAYMDIDLSTNLDSFKPMITLLITGDAGLVIGSRLMKHRERRAASSESLFRAATIELFALL